MATAQDVITSSFRLLVQYSEGDTPTAAMLADGLAVFNQLLDSWSAERLMIYATQDQQFTWTANTASRTLGASGTFVGNRPVVLDDATYFKDPSTGISYNVKIINQQQYDGIALKTATSSYPQVIFVNDTYPNLTITEWPIATKDLEWHFVSVLELSQPATLGTTLSFPPGYLRAFKFNLALDLAAEFGMEPLPQVQKLAIATKRTLKRVNNPGDIMSLPYTLLGMRRSFNIYSGNF